MFPSQTILRVQSKASSSHVTGMTSANLRDSGSVTESSLLSNLNSGSLEKTKSNLRRNATRELELNLSSNSYSFDTVNKEQSLHICNDIDQPSLKTAKQRTYKEISHAVDDELQCSDNRLLVRSAQSDQFMKDEAKERVANICPMNIESTGPKVENDNITSQFQPSVQVEGIYEKKDMIDNNVKRTKFTVRQLMITLPLHDQNLVTSMVLF
ncbi:uncharacterized protein LOC123205586 [Mangifera indica]|uniref:uncharacterized protein LOC123205586 n=1 Tax=Mangifera indica TaxID=29780 RepID=UPI001CF9704F|nr:uncharacterized protein LOC123205586 [Mangifera indica]